MGNENYPFSSKEPNSSQCTANSFLDELECEGSLQSAQNYVHALLILSIVKASTEHSYYFFYTFCTFGCGIKPHPGSLYLSEQLRGMVSPCSRHRLNARRPRYQITLDANQCASLPTTHHVVRESAKAHLEIINNTL